jgi:hypothetical protein
MAIHEAAPRVSLLSYTRFFYLAPVIYIVKALIVFQFEAGRRIRDYVGVAKS